MSDNLSASRPADTEDADSLALDRRKLTNPIEKWAAFLPEVGDPILAHVQRVEERLAAFARARACELQLEQALREERDTLWQRIRQHFVDSEIETADVRCTQRLFSRTEGGDGV